MHGKQVVLLEGRSKCCSDLFARCLFFALSIAATAAFKLKNFIVGTGLPPPMTKGPTQSCDVLNEPFFVLGLIRV